VLLNKKLQGMLNPPRPGFEGAGRFRDGDKVICLSNSMLLRCSPFAEIDSIPKGEADEFVANGEIGKASQVSGKKMMVSFTAPERTVLVAGETMGDFDLAYAVTVHKSQGSQWPVVVYMIDDYAGARFVSSLELVYTAISRAEKLAIVLGRLSTLEADCARVALAGRKTFLKELLDEAA
jgi:exodeoxyribonuclease V alpha subunit